MFKYVVMAAIVGLLVFILSPLALRAGQRIAKEVGNVWDPAPKDEDE